MPYIKRPDRVKFDDVLRNLPEMQSKGELEYCIYLLMQQYMIGKEYRYSTLHDCTYAAMHCADEFRRRNLDCRENEARDENGDINPLIPFK